MQAKQPKLFTCRIDSTPNGHHTHFNNDFTFSLEFTLSNLTEKQHSHLMSTLKKYNLFKQNKNYDFKFPKEHTFLETYKFDKLTDVKDFINDFKNKNVIDMENARKTIAELDKLLEKHPPQCNSKTQGHSNG